MKNVAFILIIILALASANMTLAQNKDSVHIIGTVVDTANQPLVMAVITVQVGNKEIAGCLTDFDGNFQARIASIENRVFSLRVRNVGYREVLLTNIKSEHNRVDLDDIVLEPNGLPGCDFYIQTICVPTIDKFSGGNIKTITSDEIERGAW